MSGLGYQLRKTADRAGFEADKLMRSNRVRAEAARVKKQVQTRTIELGRKVIELIAAGEKVDPELRKIAAEVTALEAELAGKYEEIDAIRAEPWTAPAQPPPVPQAPSQPAQLPPATTAPALERGAAPVAEQPSQLCPNCRAALRPQSAFCPTCGFKLGA